MACAGSQSHNVQPEETKGELENTDAVCGSARSRTEVHVQNRTQACNSAARYPSFSDHRPSETTQTHSNLLGSSRFPPTNRDPQTGEKSAV